MHPNPPPQGPPPEDLSPKNWPPEDLPPESLTVDAKEQLLRERLFPQLSLKFLLKLTAICAAVMWAFRAGAMDNLFWAKCLSVVLITAMACFFAYAVMFCIAFFLARVSGAILEPFHLNQPVPPTPAPPSLPSATSISGKDNA
ncbi:membrane protein [Rhodopirellula maiorica SM1]|uniref:Membrane protein n=1 Tax=Rhodopirellula maiorica SM1 TaxID=1265738 RepID=M5S2F3_9BACT|nr:hypothetical protein [Rhodopirellula maiorica]EMI20359.1 membrane protein [Rhodopirellula maiorica SM1]